MPLSTSEEGRHWWGGPWSRESKFRLYEQRSSTCRRRHEQSRAAESVTIRSRRRCVETITDDGHERLPAVCLVKFNVLIKMCPSVCILSVFVPSQQHLSHKISQSFLLQRATLIFSMKRFHTSWRVSFRLTPCCTSWFDAQTCQALHFKASPQSGWQPSLQHQTALLCGSDQVFFLRVFFLSSESCRVNVSIHFCSLVGGATAEVSFLFSDCQLTAPSQLNSAWFTAADLGLEVPKIFLWFALGFSVQFGTVCKKCWKNHNIQMGILK